MIEKSEIHHPSLLRFYDHWQEKRGARRYATRDDFDPLDLKFLLGEIAVVDVYYEPLRFKFRLHGTKLAARAGFDMTGKWLDEYRDPQFRDRLIGTYTKVIQTGEPQHGGRRVQDDGRSRTYEFLTLPLATDGALIDKLVSAMVYLDR